MSVVDVLRLGDAAAAVEALADLGVPDPREDPLVLDALAGFVALELRLKAAEEWMSWLREARRGLEPLVHSVPATASLHPDWRPIAAAVNSKAARLSAQLTALHNTFSDAVPAEDTGGRPRRLLRNFVYTLDVLWTGAGRSCLTPSVLALVAKAVDPQVGGALWGAAMANVGRKTLPTQPWADILRAVRGVDPGVASIETFTLDLLA